MNTTDSTLLVSQDAVANGLYYLKIFFGIKLVGLVNGILVVLLIMYALSNLGSPQTQVKGYNGLAETIARFYMFGLPYTIPSYTDLMSYVLLAIVGTDYDPSSEFYQYSFFVIPAILLVPRMVLFIKNAARINYLNFASFGWSLFYTITPLVITSSVYYPVTTI